MLRSKANRKKRGPQAHNLKQTETFLQNNKKKEGVITTKSGLQYVVLEETDGPKPTLESTVEVQQRISLIDGTMIDDTYHRPDPAVFTMEEAIDGYREGLLLMGKGSRYKFFLHPDLAWGRRGAGKKIGPYETLIIDARLVEIR